MFKLIDAKRDIVLAPFTTYKIGGPADYFFEPKNTEELIETINHAKENNIPFFVLGSGANILIGDKGFRGLVIRNTANGFTFVEKKLIAESGAIIADLIEACRDIGLSGLEHFVGIPSTVGGAMRQNLHFLAPDRKSTLYIESVVESAKILNENHEIKTVGKEFFQFGYDDSILHHKNIIVLEVTFDLSKKDPVEIQKQMDLNMEWRNSKQPQLYEFPSCGSVFKKIEGIGAGRLIDQVGLKGFQVGGAKVSEKHANYLVNTGNATAKDITDLIKIIQEKVQKGTGYFLEPEIGFVGEFN